MPSNLFLNHLSSSQYLLPRFVGGRYILNSLVTLDLVSGSNMGLASATLGNTLTRSGHAGVEVHSVDTNRRVVLDTEIYMFADTETEVASL